MPEVETAPVALRGLRLLYLRGQNVYTYREPFHLDLDNQGLVYVTGSNQDTRELSSSGAGKSRLFSLIPRVLFGREYLGKEPVANIWAADGTPGFYELVYWSDGIYYLVREELGKRSAALTFFSRASLDAGEWEPIGAKNKKGTLQSEVAASVNRPLDEFLGTVVWKQGHGHVLIQGTPTERIAWLSSLFGLTKYDTIYDDLCLKHDENKAKQQEFLPFVGAYTQAKASFDSLESNESIQASIHEHTAIVSTASAEVEKLRTESDAVTQRISSISSSLRSQQELARFISPGEDLADVVLRIQSAPQDMQEAQRQHSDLSQQAATVRALLDSRASIEAIIRDCGSLDPSTLALAQSTDLSILHEQLSSIRTEGHDKATQRLALQDQITSYTGLRSELQAQYQSLVTLGCNAQSLGSLDAASATQLAVSSSKDTVFADLSVASSQMDSLSRLSGLGGQCPTCGNPVDAAHVQSELDKLRPRVASLTQELSRLRSLDVALSQYVQHFTKFSSNPAPSHDALLELDARLTELRSQSDAVSKSIQDLSAARTIIDRYNAIPADIRNLDVPSTSRILEDISNKRDVAQRKASQASELIPFSSRDLTATEADLHSTNSLLQSIRSSIEEKETKINTSRSELAVLRHKEQQRKFARIELERLSTLNDKYAQVMRTDRLLKNLKVAYGRTGFKKEKLRELLTLIQEKLPVWTSILFTEDNFNVTVSGDESKLSLIAHQTSQPEGSQETVVKTFDVSEISGGEQSKLAICVMLTLIDIVADERKCNVLILDEVDRHMDKNALRLMADLLIPNLATRRSSIFMVSHQIPLSHEFDKELVVTKQRNCSSLALRNLRSV